VKRAKESDEAAPAAQLEGTRAIEPGMLAGSPKQDSGNVCRPAPEAEGVVRPSRMGMAVHPPMLIAQGQPNTLRQLKGVTTTTVHDDAFIELNRALSFSQGGVPFRRVSPHRVRRAEGKRAQQRPVTMLRQRSTGKEARALPTPRPAGVRLPRTHGKGERPMNLLKRRKFFATRSSSCRVRP